jgi:hypothetical protein
MKQTIKNYKKYGFIYVLAPFKKYQVKNITLSYGNLVLISNNNII